MAAENSVALMVFTRDLRVSDNPSLTSAATRGSAVICAFVHDDALQSGRFMHPPRLRFLSECIDELDGSLRRCGTRLEQRRGDWVEEVVDLAVRNEARSIHLSDDVTPYARRRFERLERAVGRTAEICRGPGLAVVDPGVVTPAGADHYSVFTPFYRRWSTTPRRHLLPAPTIRNSRGVSHSKHPPRSAPAARAGSARDRIVRGGELAGAARLEKWAGGLVERYANDRNDVHDPVTSRLSCDLHFGCLSPLQVEAALAGQPGSEAFLRQLCWRDFYFQILATRPEVAWSDFVARGDPPRKDPEHFMAWCAGQTGIPIVDAAMRQLATEGFVPNRARMIAASFLTRHLGLDWRDGAGHFLAHLIDADVALNNLNWQWMAGRGTGSNPHRILSPTRQAHRFDPHGSYVRHHVPELRDLDAAVIHEPWRLGRGELARLGYPTPIISLNGRAA